MNIRQKVEILSREQNDKLQKFREHRRFNAIQYINLKCDLLNDYFQKSGLKAAVVAVSGGIDSAVVLALVCRAAKAGIIQKVIPVALPDSKSEGVTNQVAAALKAEKLCDSLGVKLYTIEIGQIAEDIGGSLWEINSDLDGQHSLWKEGQVTPYTRTPVLCFAATTAINAGFPACIIGTTNRSEGAYLGYVGKFSDGAVDIQLISDLHKLEVYQVAELLDIPDEIVRAVPTGDMFDGSSDEEIFGATYDAVELHLHERQTCKAGQNLDNLHRYNAHKYRVGSPAVHLDLYESGTQGGWPLDFEQKYWTNLKAQGDIIKPGFVAPLPFTKIQFDGCLGSILSDNEVKQLTDLYHAGVKKEANINGYITGEGGGSSRASLYNVELASVLWERLRSSLDLLQKAEEPITDWQKGEIYRLVGINPLFRFIGYQNGGELVPHYDYTTKIGKYKTLYSLVIYLTTNQSGATVFYKDDQENEWNKDLGDKPPEWSGKIEYRILPRRGNHTIFPHHLLHAGEKVEDFKLIIRTDIVAECIRTI